MTHNFADYNLFHSVKFETLTFKQRNTHSMLFGVFVMISIQWRWIILT